MEFGLKAVNFSWPSWDSWNLRIWPIPPRILAFCR